MKTYKLVPVLLYGLSISLLAADSTDRTHPLDNNPACLDRQAADCVIPDNSPRVQSVIVPNAPVTPQNPTTPAPASGTLSKTPAPASNRQFTGSGVVVVPETPQTSGVTGSSNVPSLPPADQTGDFSAGRTRSGTAAGSTTVPNSPAADQTGDFSAGRARSGGGTSVGAPATPATNTTGGGAMKGR